MDRPEAEARRTDPGPGAIGATETAGTTPPIRYGPSGRRLYTLEELPPKVRLRVEHYGKWVAWSADRETLLASAATLRELFEAVDHAGIVDPLYEWLGD